MIEAILAEAMLAPARCCMKLSRYPASVQSFAFTYLAGSTSHLTYAPPRSGAPNCLRWFSAQAPDDFDAVLKSLDSLKEQVETLREQRAKQAALFEQGLREIAAKQAASPRVGVGSALSGVKVFVNGDAMPTSAAREWLTNLVAEHDGRVEVFKAVGIAVDATAAQNKLLVTGLTADRIFVQKAATSGKNAADAVLTYLYGRHAGDYNYILSDDKQWFGELPHVDPAVRTIWLRFQELEKLDQNLSQLFLDYIRLEVEQVFQDIGKWVVGTPKNQKYAERVLQDVYNGKRFRHYVENVRMQTWKNGGNQQLAIETVMKTARSRSA